ncbi:MAG: redoxin domain-containing protein [Gammaproteobacteria bacterium]|nr:redoxin domain-containing protein [Gammaproteobacteria bacterium]
MWRIFSVIVLVASITMLYVSQNHASTLSPPAAPDIQGAPWFNTQPLRLAQLRNQVVLVEFWTYGCSNCRAVEPYVKQWQQRYQSQGLTVIGVHTPEFDHERVVDNVAHYLKAQQIQYPVVMDNDFAIWKRYNNRYWPALYLIDKQGRLRYQHVGEGDYAITEQQILHLLNETK